MLGRMQSDAFKGGEGRGLMWNVDLRPRLEKAKKLAERGTEGLAELAQMAGSDGAEEVRIEATRLLGTIGVPALSELGKRARHEANVNIRTVAVETLAMLGDAAIEVLSEIAGHDGNPDIRLLAVRQLIKIGSTAIPSLKTRLKDGNSAIRHEAEQGIKQLEGKQ